MQEGVLWTNLSRSKIAAALARRGCRGSVTVVDQLPARHRLGRRSNQKSLPPGRHPQRNRQFEIIARYRAQFADSPDPVLSIDTRRREFLGLLFRSGKLYTQRAPRAYGRDFPHLATGVVCPHGICDCKRNRGHLNLGVSHDTSRFACESLAVWWDRIGRFAYPDSTRVLLLCDGGGSNSSRRHVFEHLLEGLAQRIQREIRVAHYPPYCSKFNPIERRFFPHVSEACRGLLLTSPDVVRTAMANARTRTGLGTTVAILDGEYPLKEKAPEGYKQSSRICFDEELPTWNYRAIPSKGGS